MIRIFFERAWLLIVYLYLVTGYLIDIVITFVRNAAPEMKILMVLCLALIVSCLWTLWPKSDVEYTDLILYTHQPITKRTHYYFIFSILAATISLSSLFIVFKKYKWALKVFVILFALDLPDYWIMYGEPLFYYKGIYPVEYGLIKGISMVFICSIVIIHEIYLVIKT